MGRKAHIPDPAMRRQVETMAAYGIPETDISRVANIDPKTLRKHYRDELDLGETKANAQVAGFLFNSAKNGNVSAQIFWLKTRAKWRETPLELRHSGAIGKKDLSELTDEELIAMIGTLSVGLTPVKTIEAIPQLSSSGEPTHAETNGASRSAWWPRLSGALDSRRTDMSSASAIRRRRSNGCSC